MIHVNIYRSTQGAIRSFDMSGHAMFDESGKDIVCAGASAVVIGAINAMEQLTKVPMNMNAFEHGKLAFDVPTDQNHEKVQLLLEGMVVSLETIEREYQHYIQINQYADK